MNLGLNPGVTLLCALAVPLVGALGISLCKRLPNVREALSLITAGLCFALVFSLLEDVLTGGRPAVTLLQVLPGLDIRLQLEPLGMLFALIASGLWILNTLYSIGYMRGNNEQKQTRFYVCFALAIAAALAVAFAGNLFTLFLFYEALTLITYPLVTHAGTGKAQRGGRVYLGVLMGTSVLFLLPALIYIWFVSDTTAFIPGGILPKHMGEGERLLLLMLCMFGLGKAALMPFHRWLPAAMVAPTPVSALLHAVAVVKAGVFAVVKVLVYIFGLDFLVGLSGPLVLVAGFTIIAASVVALHADNLKRLLAYSTVSQLSYVVLAAAILAPLSVAGAVMHIATHALGKITLFFAAGAIYTASKKTEVSQLDGIGLRMPWTMGAFAVGSLSMIGLPPAAGFVSKWYVVSGAYAADSWFALIVVALSTLLNAAYLLPIVYRAYFRPLSDAGRASPHGEAPWTMVLATTATAFGVLLLFFFNDWLLMLAIQTLESNT